MEKDELDELIQDALLEDMLNDYDIDSEHSLPGPSDAQKGDSMIDASTVDDFTTRLERVYSYNWHAEQARFEAEHINRLECNARIPKGSARNLVAIRNLESERRLSCLRRIDLSRRWHDTLLRQESMHADRVVEQVLKEYNKVVNSSEQKFVLRDDIMDRISDIIDALRKEYAKKQWELANSDYEVIYERTAIEVLFENLSEASQNDAFEGVPSCFELDKEVESILNGILMKADEISERAKEDAFGMLAAYLQCVLRTPPSSMTEHGRRVFCVIGVSAGRHYFGSLTFSFIYAFRKLFSGPAHQAVNQLNLSKSDSQNNLRTYATTNSVQPNLVLNAAPTVAGSEPIVVWLCRALRILADFLFCMEKILLKRWKVLERQRSLGMQAIFSALMPYLPEIPIFFRAIFQREDRVLFERTVSLIAIGDGSNSASLMEKFGVPKRFRFENSETFDLLTGNGDWTNHNKSEIARKNECAAQAYSMVLVKLGKIEQLKCPFNKANVVVEAVKTVEKCICRSATNIPSNERTYLSADNLLPLLSALVVMAYSKGIIHNFRSDLEYIDAMMLPEQKLGKTGYCLAMMLSVVLDLTSDGGNVKARARELKKRSECYEIPLYHENKPIDSDCEEDGNSKMNDIYNAFYGTPTQISESQLCQPFLPQRSKYE